jgi:hypothetical protein
MLQRLSFSDAFFKHQQRGEPDMTSVEKYKIAEDILSKNKTLFLSAVHTTKDPCISFHHH